MGIEFESVPVGSLQTVPDKMRLKTLERIFLLPDDVREVLFAPQSGAFIRGLVKGHGISLEKAPQAALIVTHVCLGDIPLAKVPSELSTKLAVANDRAQKMAAEVEKDLLAPIMPELEKYWRGGAKDAEKKRPDTAGLSNVLNLKEDAQSPPPPPMPQ